MSSYRIDKFNKNNILRKLKKSLLSCQLSITIHFYYPSLAVVWPPWDLFWHIFSSSLFFHLKDNLESSNSNIIVIMYSTKHIHGNKPNNQFCNDNNNLSNNLSSPLHLTLIPPSIPRGLTDIFLSVWSWPCNKLPERFSGSLLDLIAVSFKLENCSINSD